mmetsp:Transcript_13902/g.24280  ORF Transcript_13902/g.24280 Transcript_13902/m.24280 type:complete len:205 (-) Transcript_13902:670-1284(-)
MIPCPSILSQIFCNNVHEEILVGSVLKASMVRNKICHLSLLQNTSHSDPCGHLWPRMLISFVEAHVSTVHHDGGAVLQAQWRHNIVAGLCVACVVVSTRPRTNPHLPAMVKDSANIHNAVDVFLNLVSPREWAGGHTQPRHCQSRAAHLDEVPLPFHPVKLPDAQTVDNASRHGTHCKQLPSLVASDAELPIPDGAAHWTGNWI